MLSQWSEPFEVNALSDFPLMLSVRNEEAEIALDHSSIRALQYGSAYRTILARVEVITQRASMLIIVQPFPEHSPFTLRIDNHSTLDALLVTQFASDNASHLTSCGSESILVEPLSRQKFISPIPQQPNILVVKPVVWGLGTVARELTTSDRMFQGLDDMFGSLETKQRNVDGMSFTGLQYEPSAIAINMEQVGSMHTVALNEPNRHLLFEVSTDGLVRVLKVRDGGTLGKIKAIGGKLAKHFKKGSKSRGQSEQKWVVMHMLNQLSAMQSVFRIGEKLLAQRIATDASGSNKYIELTIIEATNLLPTTSNRYIDAYAEVHCENQTWYTRTLKVRRNATWDTSFAIPAKSPPHLSILIKDKVTMGDKELGMCRLDLKRILPNLRASLDSSHEQAFDLWCAIEPTRTSQRNTAEYSGWKRGVSELHLRIRVVQVQGQIPSGSPHASLSVDMVGGLFQRLDHHRNLMSRISRAAGLYTCLDSPFRLSVTNGSVQNSSPPAISVNKRVVLESNKDFCIHISRGEIVEGNVIVLSKVDATLLDCQAWVLAQDGRIICSANPKLCLEAETERPEDGSLLRLGAIETRRKAMQVWKFEGGRIQLDEAPEYCIHAPNESNPYGSVLYLFKSSPRNSKSEIWGLVNTENPLDIARKILKKKHKKLVNEEKEDAKDVFEDQIEAMVSLRLIGGGLSIVDGKCKELIYASVLGFEVQLSSHLVTVDSGKQVKKQEIMVDIKTMQIDNQLYQAQYPVMLTSRQSTNGDENEAIPEQFLKLVVVKRDTEDSYLSVQHFEIVSLLLQELTFKADDDWLLALLEFISELTVATGSSAWNPSNLASLDSEIQEPSCAPNSTNQLDTRESCLIQHPGMTIFSREFFKPLNVSVLAKETSLRTSRVYFELLQLPSIKINITFSTQSFKPIEFEILPIGFGLIRAVLNAIVNVLTNVDNATIRLNGLVLENPFDSWSGLTERTRKHYTTQAISQVYMILGRYSSSFFLK